MPRSARDGIGEARHKRKIRAAALTAEDLFMVTSVADGDEARDFLKTLPRPG
jgi:hypothetical protein